MPCQLLSDCLNEIFEYLEDDKITLHSCLLVNRHYCETAVRILWKNIWNFKYSVTYKPFRTHVPLAIISTLIACLPDESKDLLRNNEISIITPTKKPPLFNYPSFCKVLSIHVIDQMIQHILDNGQLNTKKSLKFSKYLLSQEILKMFMNQIPSLKSLDYYSGYSRKVQNIMFIHLSESESCLSKLSELNCSSDIYSEFFYQITQICQNIQSLSIKFENFISDGLTDLISSQNNLKSITLRYYDNKDEISKTIIYSSLTKFSLILTKLRIEAYYMPLSFLSIFINLNELILSLESEESFDDFNYLQYIHFSNLKVLKFLFKISRIDLLIKFLEINGKNLLEFCVDYDHNYSLNLAIAKFCPNLKILSTIFMRNELETLKLILNNCQYLENIKVQNGIEDLDSKEFFETLAKFSPKNFYELEVDYCSFGSLKLLCETLEEFFMNWKNRIPLKLISLIIVTDYRENIDLEVNENMNIIKKYMELGIIKKFRTRKYDDEECWNSV
ncbi:hypothetical protein RclHR1_00200031 [Rhizophagus clarus]|uniref:F-box domain-containing protein n=1 Tax=Rhizophagus clarus TaxID=94130 RepID=A0A2Z6RIT6_9GLOM|nr:hypothetical protein RclHR1_00200031 [Rhizophagus clarus]GES99480.1 hypothetical protein GLOIN_2v1784405 [Rhizophagus clarus]